jgi:ActR/RegA family two-component response regulator
MNILLWSDDLMSRVRIESAWKQAGARVLKKNDPERPDYVVVDLTARDALAHIERLRASLPDVDILAFGPHVDAEGFKAARAAGATELVARGAVVERVLRKLRPDSA